MSAFAKRLLVASAAFWASRLLLMLSNWESDELAKTAARSSMLSMLEICVRAYCATWTAFSACEFKSDMAPPVASCLTFPPAPPKLAAFSPSETVPRCLSCLNTEKLTSAAGAEINPASLPYAVPPLLPPSIAYAV